MSEEAHSPGPQAVDSAAFEHEVEGAQTPVLVDFWADWCGPCRFVGPLLERIAKERAGSLKIVKVDVDRNEDLSQRFKVRSIPTLALFKDNQLVARRSGALPKEQLDAWLDEFLGTPSTRPPGLDEAAEWSVEDGEWVLGRRDADGKLDGVVKYFRRDGSLCCETTFRAGVPHGPFQRFHEDATVSRRGEFVDGKVVGRNQFFRSQGETTENFADNLAETAHLFENGLADEVWRVEMDFVDGEPTSAATFDKRDRHLLHDGSPMPERPSTVAPEAIFDGEEDRWVEGATHGAPPNGLLRYFDRSGRLVKEVSFSNGQEEGLSREHDPESGEIVSEVPHHEGEPHGHFFRRVEPAELADERIVRQEGEYRHGTLVGAVRFLDATGAELARIEAGEPWDIEAIGQLVETPADLDFAQLAKSFAERNQLAAEVGALARVVGRASDPAEPLEALQRAITRVRAPLSVEQTQGITHYVAELAENLTGLSDSPSAAMAQYLNGILLGGDAAGLFREAAKFLDRRELSAAAYDFIVAGLALAPDRTELEYTHALILMSLGRPDDAVAAIERLRGHNEEEAAFLMAYFRSVFPEWSFWPTWDARLQLIEVAGASELAPVRSSEDVQTLAKKIAARLERLRTHLVKLASPSNWPGVRTSGRSWAGNGAPSWALPALTGFPVAELDDHEAPSLPNSIPGLAQDCKAEWLRFTWLVWLCGQDTLSMPESPSMARPFGALRTVLLARMAVFDALRRGRDPLALHDNGDDRHAELTHAIVQGNWNEFPIARLPAAMANIAYGEERALLALVDWLTNPDAPSPLEVSPDDEEEDAEDDDDEVDDEDEDEDDIDDDSDDE